MLNVVEFEGKAFFTLDHKRIGVMYLIGVMSAFTLGGFFALVLRTSRRDIW